MNISRENIVGYRFMQSGEEEKISNLVWHIFEEFEAHDYSKKGIDEFKRFISVAV